MKFISSFCVISILSACSESFIPHEEILSPTEYYPLKAGVKSVFQVQEINFRDEGKHDTIFYTLEQTVVDSFPESNGETTYIVESVHKNQADSTIFKTNVAPARRNNKYAAQNERGIWYTKLVFPIYDTRQWDSNRLNTESSLLYEYQLTEEILPIEVEPFLAYEPIKVLKQEIPENIVNRISEVEYYARGKGLIYREDLKINYCTVNCSSAKQILSGTYLKMVLIEQIQ